jgi:hypothetical protein
MLHASKFVNTKAYQKAQDRKDPLKFPLLSGKNIDFVPGRHEQERVRLRAAITHAEEEAQEREEKKKSQTQVDLAKMQKMEDLNKQEEDWMAFFMGKAETSFPISEYDSARQGSFGTEQMIAVSEQEWIEMPVTLNPEILAPAIINNELPAQIPLIESNQQQFISYESIEIALPQVPDEIVIEGPACLDDIFAELDDKFKKIAQ